MPGDKQSQEVFSRLKSAVAAKVLLQTGVAARPEEVETQVKAYIANWKSHPEAALDQFNRLEKFYKDYTQLIQNKNVANISKKEKGSNDPLNLGI